MEKIKRGVGRPKGNYPHLQQYPGGLAEKRLTYSRMKAQAKFRNETWDLTWDEYQEIWAGKWELRGRDLYSLCMTRLDWAGPWRRDNVRITTRQEHFILQGQVKGEKRRQEQSLKSKT